MHLLVKKTADEAHCSYWQLNLGPYLVVYFLMGIELKYLKYVGTCFTCVKTIFICVKNML